MMKPTKPVSFMVRCSEAEFKAFTEAAAALGLARTAWVRQVCRAAAGMVAMKAEKGKVAK